MNVKISIECEALDRIADALEESANTGLQINNTLESLVDVLEKINVALNPPEASRIFFFVEEDGVLKPIGGSMFQKVTEAKKFAIKIVDKFGNDAKVDGAPAWASSDDSLVDIAVDADGMSAVVTPKGQVGSLAVQVKADADLGAGVVDLLGEVDLELIAGDAESISISEVPLT